MGFRHNMTKYDGHIYSPSKVFGFRASEVAHRSGTPCVDLPSYVRIFEVGQYMLASRKHLPSQKKTTGVMAPPDDIAHGHIRPDHSKFQWEHFSGVPPYSILIHFITRIKEKRLVGYVRLK